MKKILIAIVVLVGTNAFAAGNCEFLAQMAAKAIGKLNGQANLKVTLVGQSGQVEQYNDEEGYLKITTNSPMGNCFVEHVDYNPAP